MDILRQELGDFYTAALQGKDPLLQARNLPIQYRDFAVWQKQDERATEHQRAAPILGGAAKGQCSSRALT